MLLYLINTVSLILRVATIGSHKYTIEKIATIIVCMTSNSNKLQNNKKKTKKRERYRHSYKYGNIVPKIEVSK
jgi:hypothetical protein